MLRLARVDIVAHDTSTVTKQRVVDDIMQPLLRNSKTATFLVDRCSFIVVGASLNDDACYVTIDSVAGYGLGTGD